MRNLQQTPALPFLCLRRLAPLGVLTVSLALAGCQHTVSDADLTNQVHAALAGDPSIHQQPVQVSVQNGVATLTGNVFDGTASSVAAQDAAHVKGIKEVVNSITVAGLQVAPTVTSPSQPTEPRQTTAEERQTLAQGRPLSPPSGSSVARSAPVNSAPLSPPAPPPPVVRTVTAPAGTAIPVRITESLSSQTAADGQPFNGVVTQEVVADGLVVIPAGSAVSGRVVTAKDAGRFKGHSELSLELNAVRRHGSLVNVTTDAYTLEGKNRGTNSAVKIGGGAAIGAALGGIFGGGKGAGIGALAGGGAGTAAQGLTHGQQVTIPSESLVRFHLAHGLSVQTTERPSNGESPALHER